MIREFSEIAAPLFVILKMKQAVMRFLLPTLGLAALVVAIGILARSPDLSRREAEPPLERREPAVQAPEEPETAPADDLREYRSPEESIVLNEIEYHPASGDARDEWIEIFNR